MCGHTHSLWQTCFASECRKLSLLYAVSGGNCNLSIQSIRSCRAWFMPMLTLVSINSTWKVGADNLFTLLQHLIFNLTIMQLEEVTENSKHDSIHLYWKNLTYKASKNKVLINNLNGHLQSGYLTAVLGPSGSGKTTLFECLAKRKITGVSGQIWVSSSTRQVLFNFNSFPINSNVIDHITLSYAFQC